MQEIILIVLFASALFYVARTIFKNTKAEGGCASNCGCESPVKHLEKSKVSRR
ncbi:MAG: FeoB-associated Cys-rich membrane protein [Bacteroidota bacterium]